MTEETKSNTVPIMLGAVAAVVVGVGVVMFVPQAEISGIQDQSSADMSTPTVSTTPVEDVAEASSSRKPFSPQFDTFRVEADGSMVVAGRAEPGQVIAIMLAGEELERATADASGNFVVLPLAGVSPLPRSLTLIADPDGKAVQSETSYIVSPIAAPEVVVAALEPPAQDPDVTQDEIETAAPPSLEGEDPTPTPDTPVRPEPSAEPSNVPQVPSAPTVLQADADGVRVVQAGPSLDTPNVGLDAITYDPEGEVQLSGRAVGDGSVQVYLDNEPVSTSPVTEGGDWRIDLQDVETGVYTLRVDEVDTAGAVVSRLETPFKREEAADVAAVLAEDTQVDGFDVAVRTVQPGSTLWAIAEESLGNGVYYVQVYEANSDLIRDPDLIYPGQIFRMPEINQ
ncbi:nucleoid-associated protein YgaU [Yoonia maritima]|uniref:Nucleoid-associated protein YgaU n=1 Tax=Yoonia maritima TaxID=1435347 RepID=A0A2T0W4J8_9RHOB|nr:LysM peptidoglycan-binding domain-containing protein [Yoonia maritima]PRY80301.1 nucleoid-associated protein YgaU [Yoonia maritima]